MIELCRYLATTWLRDQEDGQGLAEYALILGLIAVVAIASMLFLGDAIANTLSTIGATIDANT